MGPDLELKGRLEMVTEALGNIETAGAMKEPEDKHMRCASNYEDNNFEMEALVDEKTEGERSQDVEVNIFEHTNSVDIGMVEAKFQDQTENSSSFEDTISGFENGTMLSDAEVDSGLHGDASSALSVDGFSDCFRVRKKRLTPHWRTFIRPLVWRCKWVELQIKKFQSQASEYDRELAKYNRRKKTELESCVLEGFGAKSIPFSGQSQRKEVMKRRKRKRVEDTGDMVGYMSRHKLFSYFENNRSATDAPFMDDVLGNQVQINGNSEMGLNDELLSLEFNDSSVEQILHKIGVVHLQVTNMKTRLHKIMSENAGKFSSTDKLSLLAPCNALTSSAVNPASPPNNEGTMLIGSSSYMANQLIQEYNMGDLVMPESAASSHGEVTHVSDIVESTDQLEVGGSSKNIGDGILIYSRRPKEELNNRLKGVNIQTVGKKPRVPKEEQEDTSIPPFDGTEHDLPTEDQAAPKIRSISKLTATKNKRKRGRRKAALGRWSRRSSEPIQVIHFLSCYKDQFSITPRMNMIKFRLLRKLFEDASTLGFLQVLAAITETATSVKIFATFTFRNNIIYYYDFFDHVFEHYTHRKSGFLHCGIMMLMPHSLGRSSWRALQRPMPTQWQKVRRQHLGWI